MASEIGSPAAKRRALVGLIGSYEATPGLGDSTVSGFPADPGRAAEDTDSTFELVPNAMRFPSGDQTGCVRPTTPTVMRTAVVVSVIGSASVYSWPSPPTKAIRLPSGATAGWAPSRALRPCGPRWLRSRI